MADIIAKTFTESTAWDGRKYTSAARIPTFTPPSALAVTPSGSTNTLSWTNGTPTATTRIFRSPTQTGTYTLLATVNAGVASYADEGLADGVYWYRAEHLFRTSVSDATSTVSGTISGTITSGNSGGAGLAAGVLTLTGTGFPTKSRAAPIWWDTFAGATNGATLHQRAPIVANNNGTQTWIGAYRGAVDIRPSATTTGTRVAGKPSAYHPLTNSNYNCSLDFHHTLPDAQTPVYTSFWWECTPGGNNRQVKPWAVYGNRPGTDNQYPQFYIGMGNYETFPGTPYTTVDHTLRTGCLEGGGYSLPSQTRYGPINWTDSRSRWIKYELVLVQSDQNTANGMYACRVYDPDHPLGARSSYVIRQDIITRNVGGPVWRQWCYGHYAGAVQSPMSCPVHTDDIYMDDSANHVRVVVGNSADYLACTRMEDQPATAWSSTSISCTFNKGGFTTGQTGHVFLVTGAGHSGHGTSTYIGSVTIP